jgi:hypothetical protein
MLKFLAIGLFVRFARLTGQVEEALEPSHQWARANAAACCATRPATGSPVVGADPQDADKWMPPCCPKAWPTSGPR